MEGRGGREEDGDEREREREGEAVVVSRACNPPLFDISPSKGGSARGQGMVKLCEECAISEQSMR